MNDIQLTGDGNKFDWTFTETDLVDVKGDASLVSAIRHALLLKNNELAQSLYMGQGNKITDLVKNADVYSAEEIVKETLEENIRKIRGVQDAKVELTINSDSTINVTLAKITKENGEEITIGL